MQGQLVAQASLETRAQLVNKVLVVHRAIEVLRVKMELKEFKVNLELRDQLEMLVLLVLQEDRVAQVHLERQVRQV